MKILVVDDCYVDREILKNVIDVMHYRCKSVGDVDEVPAAIDSFGPDIVIIDLYMPKKTGIELAAELAVSHPNLPLFILSGSTKTQHKIDAFKEGAVRFLEKPLDVPSLALALNQYDLFLRVRDF